MPTRHSPLAAGLLLLVLTSGLPVAAQLVPVGPEVRVDTGSQHICPSVAMEPDGGFTVAWSRAQVEGSDSCVPEGLLQGRSFGRDGQPLGPVFPIAHTGTVCSFDVRLGPEPGDGGRIAVWRELHGKFGRPTVGAVEVGERHPVSREGDWILPLRSGGFVVVSQEFVGFDRSLRLVAERFDSLRSGEPVRFVIAHTPNPMFRLEIAEIADGGLVFLWSQLGGRDRGMIVGRRFDAQGNPLGPVFRVASAHYPTVASNAAGELVVTWVGRRGIAMARAYGADGEPAGPPFQVSQGTGPSRVPGRPAMDEQGNVAVFWERPGPRLDRPSQVFGQLFNTDGERLGPEVVLPSRSTDLSGCSASVATDGEGLWVVAWRGRGPRGNGIYVQRFSSR